MRLYIFFILMFPVIVESATGKINHVRGEVSLTSQGKTTKALPGTVVSSGDNIKTGLKSFAIITMDDGATFKLGIKTDLSIPNDNSINLNSGSLFSKVSKQKPNQQFKVHTPVAVIGVRGTEFFTSYGQSEDKKSDVWMCVNEGSVEVTSTKSKKSVVVNEGEGVVIPVGQDVTPPKKYAWTKKLNWNLDPAKGEVENKVEIKYENLLKEDYD